MSEVAKPVEAPVAAVTPAETTTPAVESTPVEKKDEAAAPVEAVAPASEKPVEEKKVEVKEEAKPVTEGTLGYKGPGFIKSLIFSKKFFWFGEEPVAPKDLAHYIREEKQKEVAHANAAWSSQTGKGLLYFAKNKDLKATPAGIIKLADISDVTPEGPDEFHFKLAGNKHTFQAGTLAERDGWVAALRAKETDAKATAESVTGTDAYKAEFEKLSKPVAPAVVEAGPSASSKKSTDKAPEPAKKDDTSSASEVEGADKKTKKVKRSASKSKRSASIFGSFLSKKEEAEKKHEEKKEEKEEAKEGTAAAPEAAAAVPAEVPEPAKPVEEAKPAEEAPKPAETSEPSGTVKETSKANKRNSIFGSFFNKKEATSPVEEKKEKDVAPAVPAKDTETPAASEPVDVPVAKPAEPAEETVAASSSPKKEKFFGKFLKQHKEKAPADKETEAKKSEETPALPAVEPTPAVEPVPAPVPTETPEAPKPAEEPAADVTTPEPGKEKRRASFFGNFGKKTEKKAGEVTSDSEPGETEATTPKATPNKQSKFGELLRNPSKVIKSHRDASRSKDVAAPATVEETKDTPATETKETPAAEATPSTEPVTETPSAAPESNVVNGAIGDVVPDAVTVGRTPQVQAAA